MSDETKAAIGMFLGIIGSILAIIGILFSVSSYITKQSCESFMAKNPKEHVFYSKSSGCLINEGYGWRKL